MKTILATVNLILFASLAPCGARLGWTPKQCDARYGDVQASIDSDGFHFRSYSKELYLTKIRFSGGKADLIIISRFDAYIINSKSVQAILKATVPGEKWSSVPSAREKVWQSETAFAYLKDDGREIGIMPRKDRKEPDDPSGVIVSEVEYASKKSEFSTARELYFTIENRGDKAVSALAVRFIAASEGRAVPWVTNECGLNIAGGIEPGESRSFQLSEWSDEEKWDGYPLGRSDVVISAVVLSVFGAEGESLYERKKDGNK